MSFLPVASHHFHRTIVPFSNLDLLREVSLPGICFTKYKQTVYDGTYLVHRVWDTIEALSLQPVFFKPYNFFLLLNAFRHKFNALTMLKGI